MLQAVANKPGAPPELMQAAQEQIASVKGFVTGSLGDLADGLKKGLPGALKIPGMPSMPGVPGMPKAGCFSSIFGNRLQVSPENVKFNVVRDGDV